MRRRKKGVDRNGNTFYLEEEKGGNKWKKINKKRQERTKKQEF